MITRLKISRSATGLVYNRVKELSKLYTPNIVLRNALMFSITNGDKFEDEAIDTGGTEFQIATLLGEHSAVYKLLIDQYYNKKVSDEDYKKILVFHFEKGLNHKDFKSIFK